MSYLNVNHVSCSFGGRQILDDVSFKLEKGEHIGLVGANGEGKSTLIANMAYIYAQRGAKVCLVNLDLRRPSLHRFFQVKNTPQPMSNATRR